MKVDEIDRTGTSCSQNPKIVPFREQGIEGSECARIRLWMIPTRNICLYTEPWLQRYCRKSITRFRRNGPGTDVCCPEGPSLPKRFVVEINTAVFSRNR